MDPVTIGLIGAGLGGLGGLFGDSSSSSSSSESGIRLAPESELEKLAGRSQMGGFQELQKLLSKGDAGGLMDSAMASQGNYASALEDLARSGGMPGQQDMLNAREQAKTVFQPQQVALDQSFKAEQERAARLAAQLGRPINDPIIQAKLGQSRMQSMEMMGAQQGAFIDQQSRANAFQRTDLMGQLADTRGSLATQALANRQALLSLGSGLQQQERNWRLQTGTRWGTQQGSQSSGGGIGGMISGGLMGAGAGMNMAATMQNSNNYGKYLNTLQDQPPPPPWGRNDGYGGYGSHTPPNSFAGPTSRSIAPPPTSSPSMFISRDGPGYQQPNMNFNIWGRK
jgi:hypothetical protein